MIPVFFKHFTGLSFKEDYRCKNCNLIVIGIDTLRADHLGAYGYYRNITPNIDEFAMQGILFKNTFSHSSSTLPSFATLFTSLYPTQHKAQIKNFIRPLDEKHTTLAEILKGNGYKNAAFVGDGQLDYNFGLSQGFDIYEGNSCLYERNDIYEDKCLEESIDNALKWVKGNKDEKFFLFFHSYVTHHPYMLPNEKYLISEDDNISKDYPIINDPMFISVELLNKINSGELAIDDRLRDYIVDVYDGAILYMDQGIGYFLKEIENMDLMNDTLIIFISDHGEEFMEHGIIGWHGHTLYDELIHVPFVLRGPELKRNVVDKEVRLIDIMPTLLSILDIKANKNFEGIDIMNYIDEKDNVLIFSALEYDSSNKPVKIAVREGNFKLIYNFLNKKFELYDLSKDKKEMNDLSNVNKKKVNELKVKLFEWYDATDYKVEDKLDTVTIAKLKSLGYMQ